MTKKLRPVLGLAVAGLVGTAYATCYYQITNVCVTGGTQVGWFPDCFHPIYAQADWTAQDWATTGNGSNGHIGTKSAICHGAASYTDCQGFNHTYPDYTPDPGWPSDYTAVDTSTTSCQ